MNGYLVGASTLVWLALGGCTRSEAPTATVPVTASDTSVSPVSGTSVSQVSNTSVSPVSTAGPRPATSVAAPVEFRSLAWAQVEVASGALLVEVPAQVVGSAQNRAEVMPAFRAQVIQVNVEPGQVVAAGDPLVVVRMPEVLRAAGAYISAGLRLAAHTQRREQLNSLRGEGLARLSDLAEVAAALAEAGAAQREAQAVLQAAGLSVGEAHSLSEGSGRVTLRSPIAGVVTHVSAALGQLVEPGTPALIRIAGTGPTRIEARLPPAGAAKLRYELLLSDGRIWPLGLISRAPVIDPRDGMTLAWLQSASAEPLLPGQSGRLRVLVDASPGEPAPLLLVPGRALRLGDGKVTVLRQRSGVSKTIAVQVWASAAGQSLLRAVEPAELLRGDRVAVDPSLTDGSAVGGRP